MHSTAYRTLWITGSASPSEWERVLRDDPHVINIKLLEEGVEIIYAGTVEQQAQLMRHCVESGLTLFQFAERPTDIEALFLRLTDAKELSR